MDDFIIQKIIIFIQFSGLSWPGGLPGHMQEYPTLMMGNSVVDLNLQKRWVERKSGPHHHLAARNGSRIAKIRNENRFIKTDKGQICVYDVNTPA